MNHPQKKNNLEKPRTVNIVEVGLKRVPESAEDDEEDTRASGIRCRLTICSNLAKDDT